MNTPSARLKLLILDDHELMLAGTLSTLSEEYPDADIRTTTTAKDAREQLLLGLPDLFLADLSIPEEPGASPEPETGICLLRSLMTTHAELNIVVMSAGVEALIRPAIPNSKWYRLIQQKEQPDLSC